MGMAISIRNEIPLPDKPARNDGEGTVIARSESDVAIYMQEVKVEVEVTKGMKGRRLHHFISSFLRGFGYWDSSFLIG